MTPSGQVDPRAPAGEPGLSAADARGGITALSVAAALNEILRRRLLIAGCALATAVVVVAVVLVLPRHYSATSSFIPQARRGSSNLAGLAAQFGVAVPGSDPGQSPAFYSDLITTREILGPVIDGRYQVPSVGRDSVTLYELLGKGADGVRPKQEVTLRKLRQRIGAEVALKTGSVMLSVDADDPQLAAQLNRRILDRVNTFNLEKRQTQAASERRFVELRLVEVRQELRASEDRLQNFLQANRDYRNAPSLSFEHDRLEREVSMLQQLYTTLAQSFEQAKIDEIRDSPLITIIEEPVAPLYPNPRGVLTKAILALVAGALVGLIITFGGYAVHHGLIGDQHELSQLRRLVADTLNGVLRPWRRRGTSENAAEL